MPPHDRSTWTFVRVFLIWLLAITAGSAVERADILAVLLAPLSCALLFVWFFPARAPTPHFDEELP